MRALMQLLAGLMVGLMLAGGGYAVVRIVQIQRAEKAANAADAGLDARQRDATGTGAGAATTTGAGTAPTAAAGNPGTGAVEVPNVVGASAANAMTELRQRGFNGVKLTSDAGEGIDTGRSAGWTVVKQSEKPGARVGASTVITLTCTRGY